MKLLVAMFFLLVLAAGGLFVYGVDQKQQAENRSDLTWTAKFWEMEKHNLARGKLEAFDKIPIADKIELTLWLERRFRQEELSNQSREEKFALRMALGSIVIEVERKIEAENRTRYAEFRTLSSVEQASFLDRLGDDEARLFRKWMMDEVRLKVSPE